VTPAEILVLGTGFGGLTAAMRLAQAGHRVRCLAGDAPGASLLNFGQLHSGAVYAPVLPDVAAACWAHRSRWLPLLCGEITSRRGIGLFSDAASVAPYASAWDRIGIPVESLTLPDLARLGVPGFARPPAAAFALPDFSVDVPELHARTVRGAREAGVGLARAGPCTLARAGNAVEVRDAAGGRHRAQAIVLAAGHQTPHLLDRMGIEHPLTVRRLPYATLEGSAGTPPLTYWLDGDQLAISPQPQGIRVALPGRPEGRTDSAAELGRVAAALARQWPQLPAGQLLLRWGLVAEASGPRPDPSVTVVDLRTPPPGWGQADNLIVCLPGKWTTAWHAADQVEAALAG
jgi:glycine/D-amino acid oxidase-like deaminating enzyme